MDFWGAGWSMRFGVDIGMGRGYAETSVWGQDREWQGPSSLKDARLRPCPREAL